MSVTIRNYRPEDLPVIKAITVEAFDGVSIDRDIEKQFGEINGHDWKWRKARHIDYDAERDPGGIFVAEVDGQIAGYITTFSDHEAGIGSIPNLALDAAHRGKGMGRCAYPARFGTFPPPRTNARQDRNAGPERSRPDSLPVLRLQGSFAAGALRDVA